MVTSLEALSAAMSNTITRSQDVNSKFLNSPISEFLRSGHNCTLDLRMPMYIVSDWYTTRPSKTGEAQHTTYTDHIRFSCFANGQIS